MDSNNLISKESIYRKYDHHVQTNTVLEPSDLVEYRIVGKGAQIYSHGCK